VWRRPLLILHILATVGLLGADPATIYPAARLTASLVVAPHCAHLTCAGGVVLARQSGWGLFRYWWVTIKLAITLALTVVTLTALAAAITGRVPLAVAPGVATLCLILNVGLAVYKPRWRVRSDRQHQPVGSVSEAAGARLT
jgi:hypothetical protein